MNMTNLHTNYQMDPRDTLALHDAGGRTVTCVSGSIWLTMEGDTRDVVLEPGASFTVDRDGLTLLAAQEPSVVQLSAPNQPRTWWDRVVECIDQTWGPSAIRPPRNWMC